MVNTKIRLIIFFAAEDGGALYSQQKQDRELTVAQIKLLIAKFRLKLKKVGKTTRPFRYDLNQILYDCTVDVRNRFKGLDLIKCLMNYGWRFMTLYRRQGSRPSPRKPFWPVLLCSSLHPFRHLKCFLVWGPSLLFH